MATSFQTGYAGLFQGRTVNELLTRMLWRLGETGYTRYSQALCLEILDDRLMEFCKTTRILRGWSMISMRANVRSYALPKLCLPDGLERARFFSTATQYTDLELRDRDYMDSHYTGWLTNASGTPQIVVMGEWFGNIQKINLYPPPIESGTEYSTGPSLGGYVGGTDMPSTFNDITGQATGGSTTTLEDTNADFTVMGLVAGMAVVKTNSAGGLEPVGYILTIAATTLTFATDLTNSGTFGAGDSYQIMAGEVGDVSQITTEDSYVFSADVGGVSQITPNANNMMIEFRRYATSLNDPTTLDYRKPEIPWAWHNVLADAAAGMILQMDTQRQGQMEIALATALQGTMASAVNEVNSKPNMPMKKPVVGMYVRMRR